MTKTSYRGYEIGVEKEGIEYVHFYVMRESDTWFCVDSFEYNAESEAEMIVNMKERIDNEHNEDDPWLERADQEELERHGYDEWTNGEWVHHPPTEL